MSLFRVFTVSPRIDIEEAPKAQDMVLQGCDRDFIGKSNQLADSTRALDRKSKSRFDHGSELK
jgi:hypothetical protein